MINKEERAGLRNLSTEKLEEIIELSPYRNRGDAIGNNELIAEVFKILHERKETDWGNDCATAYCYEECEKNEQKRNHH